MRQNLKHLGERKPSSLLKKIDRVQTSPTRAKNITEANFTTAYRINNNLSNKKQSRKQQEELEVNQIWEFNSSWKCNIIQHVREKLITHSAVKISDH